MRLDTFRAKTFDILKVFERFLSSFLMCFARDVLVFNDDYYLNCVDLMLLFGGNMSANISGFLLTPKLQQGWMDNG